MEAQQQGGGGGGGRGRALTWLKDTCSWQMGQLWLRKRSAEGKSALSCTASITSARLKLRSGMDISSSRVLARSGGSRAATWKGRDRTGQDRERLLGSGDLLLDLRAHLHVLQRGSWLRLTRMGPGCWSRGPSLLSRSGCPWRVSAGPRAQRQSPQSPAESFCSWGDTEQLG